VGAGTLIHKEDELTRGQGPGRREQKIGAELNSIRDGTGGKCG
jgi:hypothetical protein